ncbi:DUF5721 family protein [Ruminococcus sp. 5_1_39BFAA]|uniref:DUF5721 family protein n=1 Tax=Ruminococcus sp. 5_1_39BFAA TaxID=457412 RepID=UPI00356AE4A4
MLALKITDLKDFTNKLFIGEVFDHFWLNSAEISTYNRFTIDGKLQQNFFDNDEKEILAGTGRTYSLWKEVKPYCYSIIRGRRTPLYFKIVLQLSYKKTISLLKHSEPGLSADSISGLYLNLQYKNKTLLCTTGISFNTFMQTKHLEQLWNSTILDFFSQNHILFEEL